MSSFAERLAKLRGEAKEKAAQQDPGPKIKRRKKGEVLPPVYNILNPAPPTDPVLKTLVSLLDWKVREKKVIKELKHGALNTNFVIEVKGEGQFVVRTSRPDTDDLRTAMDVPQKREYAFSSVIGRNLVAPPCVHLLNDTKTIIYKYLGDWTLWDAEKARENYRLCLQLMKKLHSIPVGDVTAAGHALPFNVFEKCDHYLSSCKANGVQLPDNVDDLFRTMHAWQKILCSRAPPPESAIYVICHNELHGSNILMHKHKGDISLKMMDFEYAALGDRYFDIANFSRLNEFEDEEDILLLKIYFGNFEERQMVRLQLMKSVGDLYEAMRIMSMVPYYQAHQPISDIAGPSETDLPTKKEEITIKTEIKEESTAPIENPIPTGSIASVAVKIENNEDDSGNDGNKDVDSKPPTYGTVLPEELRIRAIHCFDVFASKAVDPDYTEYLEGGLG